MFFSKSKESSAMVNCQEVYSLWDLVAAKYQFVEKLNIYGNVAHDRDLIFFISQLIKILQKNISLLEGKLRQFSVNGPNAGVSAVNSAANTEVIHDKLIAQDIVLWVQGAIEMFLRSMRTSVTNDVLRKDFLQMVKGNISFFDKFIKYVSFKGWIGVPPVYPNIPAGVAEKINTGEAFHLWDHLTFRYDNSFQTEIYYNLANDTEFKFLIKLAVQSVLKDQAEILEKECLHFGIPLPPKPPNIVALPSDVKAYFQDEFIFRSIYIGILGATFLHALAVKQSVTNDRLRKLFVDLLFTEIDILDYFIKYGKVKGYINPVPKYRLGK